MGGEDPLRVNGLTARPDGMQSAEGEKVKPLGEDGEEEKQKEARKSSDDDGDGRGNREVS